MAEYCDHLKGKRRKDAGVMLKWKQEKFGDKRN
jgi:hypothetical protein